MVRHIVELDIPLFRGIRDLKLKGLGTVNLLVGGNNSGKTSVLEAVDLFAHPMDILRFVLVSKSRDKSAGSGALPTLDSIQWMFPKGASEAPDSKWDGIVINGIMKGVSYLNYVQCKEITMIPSDENYRNDVYQSGYAVETILQQFIKESPQKYFIKQDPHKSPSFIAPESSDEDELSTEGEVRAFEITLGTMISTHPEDSRVEETHTITNSRAVKKGRVQCPALPSELITPVDHRLLPVTAKAISEIFMLGDERRVVELLQLFDENIEGIHVLSPEGSRPVPYIKHKRLGYTPLSVFGDGIRRALTLATAVVRCRDGILLIDEIETAVHVKALKKLFTWLVEACKQYNVQLFATTHSLDAIDAILSSLNDPTGDDSDKWLRELISYKLEYKNGKTTSKRIPGQDLYDLRHEFGLDVR